MTTPIGRTCTEIRDDGIGVFRGGGRSLAEFRARPAVVLLGDPGAGKTTEFDRESTELGDAALILSARDFIELDLDSRPEWRDRVLFIDGLDELRAGKQDFRIPLGEIRNRLDRLRPPGFRIACREADWLGNSDRRSLEAVSPGSRISVLRLDELDDQQVAELLHLHDQRDPQDFIDKARQHGVGGLLVNPLTLRLLADAVRPGGDWPNSRRRTLEMACRQIAAEHNQEHRVAMLSPRLEAVVDAAGWLCALQLLAGIEGYVLHSGTATPLFASVAELSEPPVHLSSGDLEHALATKLFKATDTGLAPLHRYVAEFLAGRYLAKLIADGVPARRVVELMTAKADGRVVTALRGLSAWLAAHSREARPRLIDADPVGVGLYGDIGDLTPHEKEQLLESVSVFTEEGPVLGHQRQDGRSHGFRDDTAWAFRCLATADMVPTIRKLINAPTITGSSNRLAILILEALSQAADPQSMADLEQDLKATLWSDNQTTQIKRAALDAYLHIAAASDDRTSFLRLLLDAAQDASVHNLGGTVRGRLLMTLYPETVTPSEVWLYAPARTRPDQVVIDHFLMFWHKTLLDKSTDQHLTELLDSLHQQASRVLPALEQSPIRELPIELLARCLEANGDNQEPERLYGWLAAVGSYREWAPLRGEPARRVRAWLEARPQIQKEIVLIWLRQRDTDDSLHRPGHWFCAALNGSTLPPDFAPWCLDQAIEIGDTEPQVSEGLLLEAYRSLHDPSTSAGLTLEAMRERLRETPTLAAHLESIYERHSAQEASIEDKHLRERHELHEQWEQEQRQRSEDWATHLRDHQDELLKNRFSPQNLATLAHVHFGLIAGIGRHKSPQNRVSNFIGGDPPLVDAVMAALRDAALRDDLPEVDQTISWSLESRHSLLAYPVLASLNLLDNDDPDRLDALPPAQRRKALAIYYCVPQGANTQRWHDRWLRDDPDLVLDVLYQCAIADVRAGNDLPSGLNELDDAQGHHDQANNLRLKLLEAFPTRSSNQQLSLLDRLLARALAHPDHTALLALTEQKQTSTSMPIGQRIRWWATGALIVQGPRFQQLKTDLANSEVRVRHLAEFLRHIWDRHDGHSSILTDIRDPAALRQLIEILGHRYGAPQQLTGRVTLEMAMSDLIAGLIGQLGSQPDDETQQALNDLHKNAALAGWLPHLRHALQQHRVIHRDASYSHPSIQQIQDTLKNGPPSSAADLAALLEDHLTDICKNLKGSNSDPWRLFWNEDQHRHLTTAKPEGSCRDALLTILQQRRLPDVDVVREGSYAADTRADIRANCREFNVPIEIKKDSHPDLWKALHAQLIAQYTTNPATEGHGIYLVLWFKDPNKPITRHPNGGRPTTPEELRLRLQQQLSADQARKITIIVMDVTKPVTGPTN